MLTHYTKLEVVSKILANGFAWIPNSRNLISILVPNHDFSEREPQHFGMISFTENQPTDSQRHRKQFGDFGICVSDAWAHRNNVTRVIYVAEEGATLEAWKSLFAAGYREVRARVANPEDTGLLMAYHNKAIAGICGATVWASLLQLYEYMEPEENSYQREWRMVNSLPDYSLDKPKHELIRQVSPPQGWATVMNLVQISSADIDGFVCPSGQRNALVNVLPPSCRGIPITTI